MALLINDANIVMDVESGGLLEPLFCLPYEYAIPDVLFEQELAMIDARQGRNAFDAMWSAGRRLPWQEVERLLQRWP